MTVNRIVCLCARYRTYRVAIFDEMHRHFGEGFTVVARSGLPDRVYGPEFMITLRMGEFKRKTVRGIFIPLSYRKESKGLGTAMGFDCAPALPLVLARLKPQVVISDNFGFWTLQALTTGYPTVIYWQGTSYTERTLQPWRKRLRTWMAKQAKAFIVSGITAKSYLIEELKVPAHRIFVGYNCVEPPLEKFKPITTRRVQNGESVRFLFVGMLIKRKGPEHLLKVAANLKSQLYHGSRFKLIIVGDGPERVRLEELVSSLRLTRLVNFIDQVPPARVWEYYANAHVFVLPTLQDNWPNTVTEAMSMGLPILLSKYAGSVPDLIRTGENGYSFDPENHEELSRLMALYIERPELIKQHGARSLEIIAKYNPERIANILQSAASYAVATTKKK